MEPTNLEENMQPDIVNSLRQIKPDPENRVKPVELPGFGKVQLYPNSLQHRDDAVYFIAKTEQEKFLWIIGDTSAGQGFDGIKHERTDGGLLQCPLNHPNAELIRARFDFARPRLIGLDDSFGYGDRLGIANPAHIRIGKKYRMRPILAQQSIRELQRTERTPDEVMDAATWAVLQEGYTGGFGADADHLKTTEDIDLMVKAGYTMFTIDPSEHVVNEADSLPLTQVEERLPGLSWDLLQDRVEDVLTRYAEQDLRINDDLSLRPDREAVLRALLKYGDVIAHTTRLYRYLKTTYADHPSEVEVSVDETDSVTSAFEHYCVANELKRREVELVSLAPRFVGDFEKGIDYKGDLETFKTEYLKHLKIAEKIGPYKISFHSGSDKFSVYETVGALKQGRVHVKTAGTSYLEALRTVAATDPDLFRQILDFARGLYDTEKKTYHVSADLQKVAAGSSYSDEQLLSLFDQNDARQVLHVTFGKVLTTRRDDSSYLFRDRLLACLDANEDVHYQYLMTHFGKHLNPFE